ncbi:Hypothetical predicted protein [Cloeon dipterum]|uniref:Uncharacterized protein n=1 Tax=Cloeon dipterum TaxID=197152 RepID=A0A8S1D0N0_9INSE|nr:Hypothetical predicted protein [Cloeon dipterum]
MELNENMEKLTVSDNQDIFDHLRKLMEEESVSQEVLLNFLRKCSSKMDWSETSEILSSLIDGLMDVKINLNDFSEMYPSESDYELKVLQLFASRKATQISFLEIKNAVNPSENNPPQIESQMWTEITKFKNVKNLSINKHQFLLKDLMEMCKNMPSLNEIEVVIDCESELRIDDPQFIQEFSSSFKKIKEFMFAPTGRAFESYKTMSFYKKLMDFGIKNLPNLNRILPIGINFYMSKACMEMNITSQLQYLRLNAIYLEEFASKFDKFPSVQTLAVSWSEWNDNSEGRKINENKLNLLKNFTKLNDLHFSNFTSPEHLKHKMTINLKQIQETCPLLSTLEITVDDVEESQCMSSFTSLRYLDIIYDTESSEKVCLINLLSPPNLEVVHLKGFLVTRQGLREATSKIKGKAILTKVNKFRLYLKGHTSATVRGALENEGKRLVNAVLKMRQIDKEAVTFQYL